MPADLKSFFNAARVEKIAAQLHTAWPAFRRAEFTRAATRGLDALELLDRARLIARALAEVLPRPFPKAAAILIRSLGPELDPHKDVLGLGMEGFHYLPHVLFTAEHGLAHVDDALRLQHELTRRFSAEYSIRQYLIHHPERTLAQLQLWVSDPNAHVRRLVSEGTRPRLPWAVRLPKFQEDPTPVLALLERLKDDPAEYVRRSVANNLNDIGRDHPELLVDTCRRWMQDAPPTRRKVIQHALRSAIKRGDSAALAVLGFKGKVHWTVQAKVTPSTVRAGGSVELTIKLTSTASQAENAIVDAAVHYVKQNGTTRPKVFKLKTVHLNPKESLTLTKKLSLREMTTRRHYPGKHAVEILLNGQPHPASSFTIT